MIFKTAPLQRILQRTSILTSVRPIKPNARTYYGVQQKQRIDNKGSFILVGRNKSALSKTLLHSSSSTVTTTKENQQIIKEKKKHKRAFSSSVQKEKEDDEEKKKSSTDLDDEEA